MADTYGVVHGDIAAELPGLFPSGFSGATKPTAAQVTSFITTADTVVGLRVQDSTGTTPDVTDRAAALAQRYIIEATKAQVMRVVYTGNDPVQVKAAVEPYEKLAESILASIDAMGEQAAGIGEAASRVVVSTPYTVPTVYREMVINDDDLDAGSGLRGRF